MIYYGLSVLEEAVKPPDVFLLTVYNLSLPVMSVFVPALVHKDWNCVDKRIQNWNLNDHTDITIIQEICYNSVEFFFEKIQ